MTTDNAPIQSLHDARTAFKETKFINFIHSSVALQPFVGPWPRLQFRNLFYTDGRTP
jgi:hypothetical protein